MSPEWKVEAHSLGESLAQDFQLGLIVDDSGLRLLTEELVANLNGLRIEIFSNEHPPPHFRVHYAGETANFTIMDCTKLNGGLKKWERNIRSWHSNNDKGNPDRNLGPDTPLKLSRWPISCLGLTHHSTRTGAIKPPPVG